MFEKNSLIGVCYIGQRCEDREEDFQWRESFNKRGTFARLGISHKYQRQGVGSFLLNFALNKLKSDGFDGCRILVECENLKAINLYKKFKFNNCGAIKRDNHDYYMMELRLV